MSKNIHAKQFTAETLMKLDIFDHYLSEWLPVAIYNKSINDCSIFDFFAGSGTDILGSPGSPLRFLNVIKKYENLLKDKNHKVNLMLNEYKKKKSNNLKKIVAEKIEELNMPDRYLKIYYEQKDFLELFNWCYERENMRNGFNLLILDQNGVKHITQEVLCKLDEFKSSDFIFFISSSYLLRFIEEESFKKYHPKLDVSDLSKIKIDDVHRFVTEYYRTLLPESSTLKLYPFSIKKGGNIYGLIFGSHHPLGVDKFLRIAWDKNKLNGDANFDIDDDEDKQQRVLFEELRQHTKIEIFQIKVEKYILAEKRTNKDVYDFTLEQGHIPQHAVEILKKLKKENQIFFKGQPLLNYDNCYKKEKFIIYKLKKN